MMAHDAFPVLGTLDVEVYISILPIEALLGRGVESCWAVEADRTVVFHESNPRPWMLSKPTFAVRRYPE